MTTISNTIPPQHLTASTASPPAMRYMASFAAVLGRDLTALKAHFGEFVAQIITQPLLLVFVFTYLLPKTGINLAGPGFNFAAVLLPGLLASTAFNTGISTVTAPLSADLGATREIDDRAAAPLPLWAIAGEKILFGAWQALLAGLLVFPLAYFIPAETVHVHIHNWPLFVVVIATTSLLSATAGLVLGCLIRPQSIGLLYGVLVIPITFLGCVYYPWAQLAHVRWAQILVLANPLVYVSEAMRAVLIPGVKHMSAFVYLPVMTILLVTLFSISVRLLTRRLTA
jgi:ABC-2 type transport system permease protein